MPTWMIAVSVGVGTLCALAVFWGAHRWAARRRENVPTAPAEDVASALEPASLTGVNAGGDRDPFVHGGAAEQRQAPRRAGRSVAVHVSDETAQAEPQWGMVTDRSQGGLRLILRDSIEPGRILTVRAISGSNSRWVRVQVRRRRQTSDGWELGCQFTESPSVSVLWQFD